MRHVWSLLTGLVAAPLAWLFLATGQYRSQRVVADWYADRFFDTADLIGPAAFLAAAGVVLGLLGTLRWSPLGPVVAGLLLMAPTGFMFYHPFRTFDAISFDAATPEGSLRLLGQDLQPWLPVRNGTLLVLGALLLMAVFSGQRWRRWPAPAAGMAPAATPVSPAGGFGAGAGIGAGLGAGAGSATVAPAPRTEPLTDDEILAAAQALEEEEAAAAGTSAQDATDPAQPPRASG